MKEILKKLVNREEAYGDKAEGDLKHRVAALFDLLSDLYGSEKLVLRAGKLDCLDLMRADDLASRVLALQMIAFEDPTPSELPQNGELPAVVEEVEEKIAALIARRNIESRLEEQIAERMQKRQEDYYRELKMEIIRENDGPDNAQTLKKYAELEKMEEKKLTTSAMEILRPTRLEEIVGQEGAVRALLAKIASPFPQHVILYGPPGVGKTTAARLVLDHARKINRTPFAADGRFVEVDGSTLRWDPREVTNPLLGSVHDPIYQGAKRGLANSGIPEPKTGLVTEAQGGVLFIDEIGELDIVLQNKLLKVLEDKRVEFDSSYYDPADENIPKYIKKLFEEGAPADFVLIGATTSLPSELNPAIRSRCAEVFFEPLSCRQIEEIVINGAQKLGVELEEGIAALISEYTIEARKAINILADAYGLALYRCQNENEEDIRVTREDISEVVRVSRLSPYVRVKAGEGSEIGHIFALGVAGYLGTVLEIEAVVFPAQESGKGSIRFNETAGSMAKDSLFNAASVIRGLTGRDIRDYDLHVNIVGGGNIDGPSAGMAILLALLSVIENRPLRQDVAVTGEVSIQGRIKPVGGIVEKLYGARQSGIKKVIIPEKNENDVPSDLDGLEIVTASEIDEILGEVFVEISDRG